MEDFAQAAARFCALIDRAGVVPLGRWLFDVEGALATVYASAARLPDVGPATDQAITGMTTEEWASLFEELRGFLGDLDTYWVVFDARNQSSVVAASLADDLADVYRELRAGLDASRSGAPPEDVLFEWRTSFEIHWAAHALGALGAIRDALKKLGDDRS